MYSPTFLPYHQTSGKFTKALQAKIKFIILLACSFSRIKRGKWIIEKGLSNGKEEKKRVKIPRKRLNRGPFRGKFPKFKVVYC